MARSLLGLTGVVAVVAAVGGAGCHVSGCRAGDQACALMETAGEGSTSRGMTGVMTETPTSGTDASVTTDEATVTEPDTTSVPEAVCGDGVVAGAEECDDGNEEPMDACLPDCTAARCGDGVIHVGAEQCDDADEDNTNGCTNQCKLARCGDGFLHPPEACDAGKANSNVVYGGCTINCKLGARCGDGELNGPEECDDANDAIEDGCLEGCVKATSCLQILGLLPDAPSGIYRVWPEASGGEIDVEVYCDMETDGGGYTFLKVDTQVGNTSDKGAKAAEAVCAEYGMHLFVPRTQAHLKSAYALAIAANVVPVGGGEIGKGSEYLSILAIFPTADKATCGGKGLNSADCPLWRARDDGQFWVTKIAVPGEPSDEHCLECSMFYKWNMDGTLKSYTTFPVGEGASSYRFFCDIADKV